VRHKNARISFCSISRTLASPVTYNLTKDPTVIREDPNIEIVGADTAIVVWGQDSTPAAEDNYDIYAAVVTGLSGTPVLGTPVLLAAGDGAAGSMGNRFPVIDGNLVAWSYHWVMPQARPFNTCPLANPRDHPTHPHYCTAENEHGL